MKMTRTVGIGMLIAMLCATINSDAHPPVITTKSTSTAFTQNVGQVTDQHFQRRNDIDFKLSAGNGLNIFIGAGKLHYQFSRSVTGSNEMIPNREDDYTDNAVEMYRLDVELIGSNTKAKVITENRAATFERYYTNGLQGAVAHQYSRITYKDVYPNIDWVFYFNAKGQLEHDFIVHPNGRVSDIKIRYLGATQLILNDDGSLTAVTPFGTVKENTPYAYQQQDKQVITSSFVLKDNVISFSTADYTGTLVIDPVLEWGSYYGDSGYDDIVGTKMDGLGHLYITGSTSSVSNIATTGGHQITIGGISDAYVVKFHENGTRIWATYYGGMGNDYGKGIALDTGGDIYLAGRTQSATDIATAASYQDTKAGTAASYDAFLVKFDTSGQREWATYYGGTGQEGSQHTNITTDRFGNIYLTGNTQSANGISTVGAFQEVRPGGHDAFLAKFSSAGHLSWSTYYGGTSGDYGSSVTTDITGNVYLLGYGGSSTLATANVHQSVIGGAEDAFLVKFDSTGMRIWATYYGGLGIDWGYGINSDDSCHIYIAGTTLSASGIATPQSHQQAFGGVQDGFAARFDSMGTLHWATYIGGSGYDISTDIFPAPNGQSYVLGHTSSTGGIASSGAIQPNLSGFSDAFVLCFESSSGINIWGSYFGGNDNEEAMAITGDHLGKIYIGGATSSAAQLSTTNAHQTVFGGDLDGMLLLINDCEAPDAPLAITGDTEICGNDTILYSIAAVAGVDGYSWILPAGWLGNSDSTSIFTTPDNNQSGVIQVAATNYCTTSDTISLAVTVLPAPQPEINRNNNILSTTQPYSSYQWSRNGQLIAGATNSTYVVTQNGDYTVTVTAANDCGATSDVHTIDHLSNGAFARLSFEVYPNPASGILYIETKISGTMQLHDVTGRNLLGQDLKTGTNAIDLGKLQNGIYLIRVHGTDGSYMGTVKMLKTKE